jgi:hypothetical protein
MQYKVDKFKVEDWYDIEPREEAAADLEAIKKETIFDDVYTNGMPFYTLRADGEIIVIYGFMYAGCGTYMPAVVAGKNIDKHTKKVIKLFYEYFATQVPRDCRRLEAYCDIMDEKALRLAKHFGFDVVGIRHNASADGHDQAILERLTRCDIRKTR